MEEVFWPGNRPVIENVVDKSKDIQQRLSKLALAVDRDQRESGATLSHQGTLAT
eukprot:COSAG04_NODE_11120_length_729_cov_1.484127_1_plen_53_part_10